jgi:hypothetical protein
MSVVGVSSVSGFKPANLDKSPELLSISKAKRLPAIRSQCVMDLISLNLCFFNLKEARLIVWRLDECLRAANVLEFGKAKAITKRTKQSQ